MNSTWSITAFAEMAQCLLLKLAQASGKTDAADWQFFVCPQLFSDLLSSAATMTNRAFDSHQGGQRTLVSQTSFGQLAICPSPYLRPIGTAGVVVPVPYYLAYCPDAKPRTMSTFIFEVQAYANAGFIHGTGRLPVHRVNEWMLGISPRYRVPSVHGKFLELELLSNLPHYRDTFDIAMIPEYPYTAAFSALQVGCLPRSETTVHVGKPREATYVGREDDAEW